MCLSSKESYCSSAHRRVLFGVSTETSSHARHLSTNGTNEATGSPSYKLWPAENPRHSSVMAQCKRLWHELRGDELPTLVDHALKWLSTMSRISFP
ncbi:hypothetical protein SCLCIDRAFT_307342 [Scleroderma citrinum Foug A]|uniref:Uncharacterized protein n=1 Tax=Scleroderma citrinum Foug A TaxID=1036808 RepID=A0A0C2ZS30_9AGAM|nr:hypothetical protein SCLCIDRAFT_307342 [Scleroderma citrinum Foug A]